MNGLLKTVIFASFLAVIVSACSDKPDPMPVQRLDRFVARYETLTPRQRSVQYDSLKSGADIYLMYNGESPDNADEAFMYLAHTPAVSVFSGDVEQRIGDLTGVEAALGYASDFISRELPDARFSDVYAVVSADPFESVVVSDSIVLVALNHYLGADYAGYQGMPAYRRRVKSAQFMAPDIVEAVVAVAYPYQPAADGKLLNRMLYDGALLYAMHRALPDFTFSQLTGWTDDEVKWLTDNEKQIYAAIIERDLLYSASHDDMRRLLSHAPATTVIHHEAPGRAGLFIGFRMVEAYVNAHRDDYTLRQLLSPSWYNDPGTLAAASYNPNR